MANAVTDATFQKDVLDAKGLVLVDFWAEWCTPCKILEPVVDEISSELGAKVSVLKMDVDENNETASKYMVMSIPTMKLFKNGEMVENWVGVQPKDVYVEAIQRHAA
ncbi:MAG TPA: thioredoxin [Candidatus Dojkabacteria bacterium]|jgi:thioredoxin 1